MKEIGSNGRRGRKEGKRTGIRVLPTVVRKGNRYVYSKAAIKATCVGSLLERHLR